jgi:hypothetical protein
MERFTGALHRFDGEPVEARDHSPLMRTVFPSND